VTTKLIIKGKLSPREQLFVETESGVAISAVESVLTDPERPKLKVLTTLLLVALRREKPSATLDDVLDGDYELEFKSTDADPLPPPSVSNP
jgi:hypothetical protein